MDRNLERLKLKTTNGGLNLKTKQPSTNYYINDKEEENTPARMISEIIEILKIIENITDEKTKTISIYKYNNLTKCCTALIEAGYIPKIKFQGGRITFIHGEFNEAKIRIETQCLLKSDLNGYILFYGEVIFNKMNK